VQSCVSETQDVLCSFLGGSFVDGGECPATGSCTLPDGVSCNNDMTNETCTHFGGTFALNSTCEIVYGACCEPSRGGVTNICEPYRNIGCAIFNSRFIPQGNCSHDICSPLATSCCIQGFCFDSLNEGECKTLGDILDLDTYLIEGICPTNGLCQGETLSLSTPVHLKFSVSVRDVHIFLSDAVLGTKDFHAVNSSIDLNNSNLIFTNFTLSMSSIKFNGDSLITVSNCVDFDNGNIDVYTTKDGISRNDTLTLMQYSCRNGDSVSLQAFADNERLNTDCFGHSFSENSLTVIFNLCSSDSESSESSEQTEQTEQSEQTEQTEQTANFVNIFSVVFIYLLMSLLIN